MKKQFKHLGMLFVLCSLCMLTACGERADETYVGKWISVAGEAMGVTMTGDDISGYELELESGGKGVLIAKNESQDVKWSNDDGSLTITYGGIEMIGSLDEDTIQFDNMLNLGITLKFAREGSEAAKPENNLPEADQKMLGKWQSYKVVDVLGDPVTWLKGDELKLEFYADHTVDIYDHDVYWGIGNWSFMDQKWGTVENNTIKLDWEVIDSGIKVNYSLQDEYYTFYCKKN